MGRSQCAHSMMRFLPTSSVLLPLLAVRDYIDMEDFNFEYFDNDYDYRTPGRDRSPSTLPYRRRRIQEQRDGAVCDGAERQVRGALRKSEHEYHLAGMAATRLLKRRPTFATRQSNHSPCFTRRNKVCCAKLPTCEKCGQEEGNEVRRPLK